MKERSAVNTIRGYFYQFNKTILEIISLENENDSLTVEGIEDIDLKNRNATTLIQCKYYSGQEYNHSVIKDAIINFFEHYITIQSSDINYCLYANFKSGQEKLPKNLTVPFVKKHFLTYTKNGSKHELFTEKNIDDMMISSFIKKINIDIFADSYQELENKVLTTIQRISNIDKSFLNLYYIEAESIIKQLATSKDIKKRKITKKEFIDRLLELNVCLDEWFFGQISYEKYCSSIRKKYFSVQNVSPFERFFLIDCSHSPNINSLKNIIYIISEKWSKLSKHSNPSFCPYIVFYNINDDTLLKLKTQLFNEDFRFIDGYCFKNSSFSTKAIFIDADYYNKIKIKLVEFNNLDEILKEDKKTILLYQFYFDKLYFNNTQYNCANIRINNIDDLVKIV